MKHTLFRFSKMAGAIAIGAMIGQEQLAVAGWTGAMNGSGFGQASVNVRAFETSLAKKRTATTTNMVSPSASIAPTTGYATNAPLPVDASPATVARVKGLPGYIWQAETVGSDGDSTDNEELESRVKITAAECAAAQMSSSAVIAPDDKSGTITMNINATAGTAVWSRGFEFLGDPSQLPNDDPDTEGNETIEFLKTNVLSSLKWDVLLIGPLNLNAENCNAVTIPFTVETSVSNNLYYVTDAVAKSLPLVIECPADIVVDCQQPVTFPETVLVGGCGNITVAFNPPYPEGGSYPAGIFPVGTTPVTVTATDKDGNSTSCTFNVIVTDNTAPVAPVLPNVTTECGTPAILTSPTATDNCAGPVVGTTTTTFPITTPGTTVVTWTFSDGNGNTSTANQTVTVTGLDFHGFYSPIGGTGGTCDSPLRTANRGNTLPVKFDVSCNGSPVTTGTPTLSLRQCSGGNYTGGGNFNLVGNEWHFNWDTSGRSKGVYELVATLQDGSARTVFVKLK